MYVKFCSTKQAVKKLLPFNQSKENKYERDSMFHVNNLQLLI